MTKSHFHTAIWGANASHFPHDIARDWPITAKHIKRHQVGRAWLGGLSVLNRVEGIEPEEGCILIRIVDDVHVLAWPHQQTMGACKAVLIHGGGTVHGEINSEDVGHWFTPTGQDDVMITFAGDVMVDDELLPILDYSETKLPKKQPGHIETMAEQ